VKQEHIQNNKPFNNFNLFNKRGVFDNENYKTENNSYNSPFKFFYSSLIHFLAVLIQLRLKPGRDK